MRDLVYKEYGAEICTAADYATKDSPPPSNYTLEWNKALTMKVSSVSDEERERLQGIVDTEKNKRKTNSSVDDIFV